MMKRVAGVMVMSAVVGAIALATAHAAKPGGGGGGGGGKCPRDISCPDVWSPVICSDGVIYSNSCYAFQQCATGCQSYDEGGGGI